MADICCGMSPSSEPTKCHVSYHRLPQVTTGYHRLPQAGSKLWAMLLLYGKRNDTRTAESAAAACLLCALSFHLSCVTEKKRKEKSMLFSDNNGSLLRRQLGAGELCYYDNTVMGLKCKGGRTREIPCSGHSLLKFNC